MATRQYIGARYVPKFYQNSVDGSADWESNVVYDPLTYVTLSNGHMYISKKRVPATVGTPATNADYWLDIGSYNGFIEELQNQIDALESEIAQLDDEVYVVIGDSWSNYYIGNDRIIDIIAASISNGKVHKQDARGGAGFIGNYGGYTYGDILTSINNNMTADERAKVKHVVVIGGENDGSPTAVELQTAVQSFVTNATTLYPDCDVTYIHATGTVAKNFNENHRLLVNLTTDRFIFLAGFPNVMVTANLYQNDGHPASDLRSEWCKWVIALYRSHKYQFYKNVNVTSALATSQMSVSGGTVNVACRDNEYRLFSNYITIDVTDGFRTWEGNALLFEFQNDYEHPCPVVETRGWARLMFEDDSYEVVPVWGTYMSDTGNYGVVITQRSFANSNVGTVRVRLDMIGHTYE